MASNLSVKLEVLLVFKSFPNSIKPLYSSYAELIVEEFSYNSLLAMIGDAVFLSYLLPKLTPFISSLYLRFIMDTLSKWSTELWEIRI